MSIERIEVGPRMSQVVVHGDTVYLAGVVADKRAGTSVADQTTQVLRRIDELLAKAGTDKTKILKATIWLRDIASFDEMNTVWDKWVSPGNAPARACVESRMAAPDVLVEIQVTAVKG
ncbi:RidA family protein [Chelativorans sp. AA-79]|uniref:RidA family protein n=1 Tax=Chelativorans sp. AA-79 TaxID=3028735 RepID=UPI0023F8DEAA|nr:RidA family protein [Chelativorans sp. AA-79]WEX10552.1 RidA family protein [Chelativorans sp. AA-79]